MVPIAYRAGTEKPYPLFGSYCQAGTGNPLYLQYYMVPTVELERGTHTFYMVLTVELEWGTHTPCMVPTVELEWGIHTFYMVPTDELEGSHLTILYMAPTASSRNGELHILMFPMVPDVL